MSDRSAQHTDAVTLTLSPWIYVSENTFNASTWSSLLTKDSRGQNAEVLCLLSATAVCVNLTSSIKELALTAVTGVRPSVG